MNDKSIWDYCKDVEYVINKDFCSALNQRDILNDMEAVCVAFDGEWTAEEAAETIYERKQILNSLAIYKR